VFEQLMESPNDPDARPSMLLQLLEMPRAMAEYGALWSTAPLLRLAPRGDGSPVVVLPGFTGSDASTMALRAVLRGLGHHVVGWGLGQNLGPTRQVIAGLDRLISTLVDRHGGPVSLVGWSLGGIFARRIATVRPDDVRRVVTLGTPYRLEDNRKSRAHWVYRSYEHLHDAAHEVPLGGPASRPLAVPSTSVFSRTDGVVPWGSCREPAGSLSENIGVPSSHNGLGHHPLAAYVVADRLALAAGTKAPFLPPPGLRAFFEIDA
jgi:pimeloyl-ACP methyl ester carboxylesterase